MKTTFSKRVLSVLLAVLLCVSCFSICMVSASAAMELYVRGDFNSWGASDAYKMTTTDNGATYTATVLVKAGTSGYKIATNDWSYEIGGNGGANLSITVDFDSYVTFTATTASKTVKTSAEPMATLRNAQNDVVLRCAWSTHGNAVLVQEGDALTFHDYSTDDMTNLDYYWNVTSADGGKGVYVQNADTDMYLAVADGAFAFTEAPFTWDSKFVNGAVNLSYDGKSINIEDWQNGVKLTALPANYESAQWKFFYESLDYELTPNGILGTGYDAVAEDGTTITSTATGMPQTWKLSENVSKYPTLKAEKSPLLEAVYNLSMEEFIKNQYNDPQVGTALKTGDLWNKVWTRDSAYSNLLSLSWLEPEIADNCNRKKVHTDTNSGIAVFEQDTGTGGSYPVSTDKIILLSSVWETYLSDGNTENLAYFYDVAYNTMMQDLEVAMDDSTGLLRGETGGIDWRDQTYPDWMSSKWNSGMVDIAEGRSAVVNATYVHGYEIMARMADILGKGQEAIDFWTTAATKLEEAMSTQLWNEDLGIYSSWMYPEYMGNPLSGKGDVLGNGFALWFDVGTEDQIQSILDSYPLVNYGAPTTYPQKMGNGEHAQRYYHNRGIWPGWQTMMMVGANLQGNEEMAEEIFDSNIHCAAGYLSNYEVVNYETGEGIHSRKQLWSVAGTLAGYYRLIFGMNYDENGITFNPTVQDWVEGPVTLNNYKYRNATLNITVNGTGDTITSFIVNGEEKDASTFVLPTDAEGTYTIEITVDGNEDSDFFSQGDEYLEICPSMPKMNYSSSTNTLSWTPVAGLTYKLWTGSEYIDVTGQSTYKIDPTVYGSYSLLSIAESGIESEYSEPIIVSPDRVTIEAEDASLKSTKYISNGYVIDRHTDSAEIQILFDAPKSGKYLMHGIYNNFGAGQDGLSAGIRSVYVDGVDYGTMVFPEHYGEYKNQESSHLALNLAAGKHIIKVVYDTTNPYDQNMAWYVKYDIASDKNDYVSGLEFKNDVEFDKFIIDFVEETADGMAALPEDTTLPSTPEENVFKLSRIYFDNTVSNWAEVHIYGWDASGLDGNTMAMTEIGDTNIWYADLPNALPVGAKCILFKATAGTDNWDLKTDDVEIVDGKNCVKKSAFGTAYSWTVYQDPNATEPSESNPSGHTYTVAGSAGLCGTEWDTANTANDMTYVGDNKFQKVFTGVATGNYEFKVAEDHKWDVSYGDNGGNISVAVAEDNSTVTITFDYVTTAITYTVAKAEPQPSDPPESSDPTATTPSETTPQPTETTPQPTETEPQPTETEPQPTETEPVEEPELVVAKTIKAGKKTTAKVENAGDADVAYSTKDNKIVKVDAKTGKVTALKKGTATITAKVGDATLTATIKVKNNPTVKLGKKTLANKAKITVNKGKKIVLKIKGKASDIANKVKLKNAKIGKITSKANATKIVIKTTKAGKSKLNITINKAMKYTFNVKVK